MSESTLGICPVCRNNIHVCGCGQSIKQEPLPKRRADDMDLWKNVINDMNARRDFGLKKYGTVLQPFNGRNPLVDAYQEQLDNLVYTKQAIIEFQLMKECIIAFADKFLFYNDDHDFYYTYDSDGNEKTVELVNLVNKILGKKNGI